VLLFLSALSWCTHYVLTRSGPSYTCCSRLSILSFENSKLFSPLLIPLSGKPLSFETGCALQGPKGRRPNRFDCVTVLFIVLCTTDYGTDSLQWNDGWKWAHTMSVCESRWGWHPFTFVTSVFYRGKEPNPSPSPGGNFEFVENCWNRVVLYRTRLSVESRRILHQPLHRVVD